MGNALVLMPGMDRFPSKDAYAVCLSKPCARRMKFRFYPLW